MSSRNGSAEKMETKESDAEPEPGDQHASDGGPRPRQHKLHKERALHAEASTEGELPIGGDQLADADATDAGA
ncbi:hypothetical protein [Neorhodopirellula lusitana]|nr:hypothetical protein [Neorhodopirellula lusitana]